MNERTHIATTVRAILLLGLSVVALGGSPALPAEPILQTEFPSPPLATRTAALAPGTFRPASSVGESSSLHAKAASTVGRASYARFVDGQLVPRLERQFAEMVPQHEAWLAGDSRQFVRFEELNGQAQHGASRAAKKAVKNFLIENTPLFRVDRAIDGVKRRHRADEGLGRPKLGLGISHGAARVELRVTRSLGSLRLRLHTDGSAGVEFKDHRQVRSSLSAGYSARDRSYGLACRYSF